MKTSFDYTALVAQHVATKGVTQIGAGQRSFTEHEMHLAAHATDEEVRKEAVSQALDNQEGFALLIGAGAYNLQESDSKGRK